MKRDVDMLVELSRLMVGMAYLTLDDKLELRQFRALAFIAQRGLCSVGELSQDSALPSASTTRLCDNLVDRGWVRRTSAPDDRRQVLLELTTEGHRCVQEVLAARAARLRTARNRMSPQARAALAQALPELLSAMRKQGAGAAWAV